MPNTAAHINKSPNRDDALFVLRIAGLSIGVAPLAPNFDRFAGEYGDWADESLLEQELDLCITVTQQMIDHERETADQTGYSDAYLQTLAVYRKIADASPALGIFLMHAAVVEYEGRAYAFIAPSGTGKSTHLRLWKQLLGSKATIINGDKPLIRMTDGQGTAETAAGTASCSSTPTFTAYGTPWCGKEGWNVNTSAPLAGICCVNRGQRDECRRIGAQEALDAVMAAIYMPQSPTAVVATLDFADALLANVPIYRLSCTMNPTAAKASFEAMTGQVLNV